MRQAQRRFGPGHSTERGQRWVRDDKWYTSLDREIFCGCRGQALTAKYYVSQLRPLSVFYDSGFAVQDRLEGSVYAFTNGVPLLNFATGQISLAGGNLGAPLTNSLTLQPDNVYGNPGVKGLSVSITPTSGFFRGSVPNPSTGKNIAISGAILQKKNRGFGLFLGTNEVGGVSFEQNK